jgi:perosamine synthetase
MKTINVSQPKLVGNAEKYVSQCVNSGWLTQGPRVKEFEERFASYIGMKHGIATTSGTTALHLVLAAMNIGPGDEVIVPNLTFVATANAVKYCGATPVFVDVDSDTWNINPKVARLSITSRTKAIIVVHLYGLSADMSAFYGIGEDFDIPILEDAAEAIGGEYKGRKLGSIGHAAVFSFYGNKTITTGEGGMIVTDDEWLNHRLRHLRGQALDPKLRYFHTEVGFNYRMTDLQAAIGLSQIEIIDSLVKSRQRVWSLYADSFQGSEIGWQYARFVCRHAGWMFVALFKDRNTRCNAELALEKENIETRPMFVPMSKLPMYADSAKWEFPVSLDIAERGLCLPTHSYVTDEDIDRIVSIVKESV